MAFSRSTITSTGTLIVSADLDRLHITRAKNAKHTPAYRLGSSDAVYSVDSGQFLMTARNQLYNIHTKFIGCANGMGVHPKDDREQDIVIQDIMSGLRPLGIAMGTCDASFQKTEGVAIMVGGTHTVHAQVDMPQGSKVYVTVPKASELSSISRPPGVPIDRVQFVLAPAEDDDPSQMLKAALRSALLGGDFWKKHSSFNGAKLLIGSTVDLCFSYQNQQLLAGIFILIQTGIIKLDPSHYDESEDKVDEDSPVSNVEVAGTKICRKRIRHIYNQLCKKGSEDNHLQHLALAVVIELASLLCVGLDGFPATGEQMGWGDATKNLSALLRKAVGICGYHDGESGVVASMLQTRSSAGSKLDISTEIGFIPKKYAVKEYTSAASV